MKGLSQFICVCLRTLVSCGIATCERGWVTSHPTWFWAAARARDLAIGSALHSHARRSDQAESWTSDDLMEVALSNELVCYPEYPQNAVASAQVDDSLALAARYDVIALVVSMSVSETLNRVYILLWYDTTSTLSGVKECALT